MRQIWAISLTVWCVHQTKASSQHVVTRRSWFAGRGSLQGCQLKRIDCMLRGTYEALCRCTSQENQEGREVRCFTPAKGASTAG